MPKKKIILTIALSALMSLCALADILLVGGHDAGIVATYDSSTGQVVNPEFITGLAGPYGIAHDVSSIYISNTYAGTVGKYDIETGAAVVSPFISGLTNPSGLVVHEGTLYIASTTGAVSSFNAETGETINPSLISAGGSRMIGVHNNCLYVGDFVNAVIGVYNLDGTTINAKLVSDINPGGIAFSGTNMYVVSSETNSILEFNAVTGELVAEVISSGLSNPVGLAIDSEGHLLVANLTGGQGSVGCFKLDGTVVENPFIVGPASPLGLDCIHASKP
jgi:sugar lactone lactonase YvrE